MITDTITDPRTPAYIAATVLERRTRMNPTVFQGEILDDLGPDGLGEAINRRWLIPDTDSGYLQVTNEDSKVREMEVLVTEEARAIIANGGKPLPRPEESDDPLAAARAITLGHAFREALTIGVGATAGGPVTQGAGPSAYAAPQMIRNPNPTPSATTGPQEREAEVGHTVTVVQDGVAYQGVVADRDPRDKTVKVTFGGGQRPPDLNRRYKPEEVKLIKSEEEPGS